MAPGNIPDEPELPFEPREEDIAADDEMQHRVEYFEEIRKTMDDALYEDEARVEEEEDEPVYDSRGDPWAAQDEARFREEGFGESS